ncbi:hypothetical protein [Oricola cellulosilytica]|uniref:Uncharacterized protein n=1 Tax=Oricola cellulosilytica TaxID=1429082 RepID=A0A4R0P5V2_9HYPH|nr:hypothetical protein [Oricola cellulosilytica]TCD12294.1 hypothetical protein E0D97_14840 [Oricola cellulosilytica]
MTAGDAFGPVARGFDFEFAAVHNAIFESFQKSRPMFVAAIFEFSFYQKRHGLFSKKIRNTVPENLFSIARPRAAAAFAARRSA